MLFVDGFSVFWLLVSCFYFVGCSVFLYCSYIVPVYNPQNEMYQKLK